MSLRNDRYERVECRPSVSEDRIIRDVYGCDAGRNCAQTTLEQRIFFEKQIAERIAGLQAPRPGHC